MAKASRKSSKPSTSVPEGAPPPSPETSAKSVTTRRTPREQEDVYGMVDAGELWIDRQFKQRQEKNRAKRAAEEAVRIRHVEGLRQQMMDAGVDVTRPTPGISRLNPELFAKPLTTASGVQAITSMASKDPFGMGKQRKTTTILRKPVKKPSKFKSLVRRIIKTAGSVLSGSHMNVDYKSQPEYGGTLKPRRVRQGPSPK